MHTIEIATTPLSRPVRRQFTAVPPTSAYEGPQVRWYRASCGERRRRDTMAGTSTDTGMAGARPWKRAPKPRRSGAGGDASLATAASGTGVGGGTAEPRGVAGDA